MKKTIRFMSVILAVSIFTNLMPFIISQSKVSKAKTLKAYSTYLSKSKVKWGDYEAPSSEIEFAKKDLNNDGVPELILYWSNASVSQSYYRVYTFTGNSVKELFHVYSGSIIKTYMKKSIVCVSGGHSGHYWDTYYKVGTSTAKVIFSRQGDDCGTDSRGEPIPYYKIKYRYYIGTKKVSKAEFKKYKKKVIGKSKNKNKYTYHNNTKTNREKYLS